MALYDICAALHVWYFVQPCHTFQGLVCLLGRIANVEKDCFLDLKRARLTD